MKVTTGIGKRVPLRASLVLPVAAGTLLAVGTGTAFAGPSARAAAVASAHATASTQVETAHAKAAAHVKTTHVNTSVKTTAHVKTTSSASSDHSNGNAGTSGDPTQPQPLSRADRNSGGANGQCPGATYCSTRDGSPSGNGNGGGKSVGKPCAGCVGKADNKNPPGQEKIDPYNTFPNNGYECDRNHGIGRSNPAHTGCKAPATCPEGQVMDTNGQCVTPPVVCPDGQVMDDSGNCVTPPTECVPTQANNFCSTVLGEHHSRNPKSTKVLGEKVVRTPGALPFTGAGGIGLLVGAGALALALGTVLSLAVRRRAGGLS